MESPSFTEKLGTGKWIGIQYVIDRCPMCGDKESLKFTGIGQWGCTGCHKGGKDLRSFRTFLASNPMMASYVESIKEPVAPEEVVVLSEYQSPYQGKVIGTGFGDLDFVLGGLVEGGMTIVTGKRAEGKSSFISQLTLNAVDNGHNVCFYSGELSTGRFQSWMFGQAAGARNMDAVQDQFGATRWIVRESAEKKIREWLGTKIVLYDNTKVKSSEQRTILKSFNKSRAYYGCDLFIVDNLMTARYDLMSEKDSLVAQASFASEMMDFARQNNVHMIMVAHPRKGEAEDINDSVAGLGTITNMATNVIQVRKIAEEERIKEGCDAMVTISKNREHGDTGMSKFMFDKQSKRFMPCKGSCISRYGWDK